MMRVKLVKDERLRRILVAIFYVAYLITVGYCLKNAGTVEEICVYLILLLAVPVGIWTEIIRYCYTAASDALNEKCDPLRCMKLNRFVRRGDILQQFTSLALYQGAFAMLDMDQSDQILPYLEKYGTANSRRAERINFDGNYLLFSLAAVSGDRKAMKLHYQQLERLMDNAKSKNADMMTLQMVIAGIYLAASRDSAEAIQIFETVELERIRPREQAYYYYYFAKACAAANQTDRAAELYGKARTMAPNITLFAHKPII